jgi:hypothetical protein
VVARGTLKRRITLQANDERDDVVEMLPEGEVLTIVPRATLDSQTTLERAA